MQLSARAYNHVFKLARSIVDLAGSEQIQTFMIKCKQGVFTELYFAFSDLIFTLALEVEQPTHYNIELGPLAMGTVGWMGTAILKTARSKS